VAKESGSFFAGRTIATSSTPSCPGQLKISGVLHGILPCVPSKFQLKVTPPSKIGAVSSGMMLKGATKSGIFSCIIAQLVAPPHHAHDS